MPDIGLTELIVIGLILFLVVGPERFPEFFGQVTGMIRKARDWVNETKGMVRQETDSLKEPITQTRDAIQDELRHASAEVKNGLGAELDDLRQTGKSLQEGRLSDILPANRQPVDKRKEVSSKDTQEKPDQAGNKSEGTG